MNSIYLAPRANPERSKFLSIMIKSLAITVTLLLGSSLMAAEYHVSPSGNDANKGTSQQPLLTIQAAADLAQPGDVITVHAGTYRERINPPRGGTSDSKRIVYRAVPCETVVIKGSEVINEWEKQADGMWLATLPNQFFGDYNPYKDLIAGDWFKSKGRVHHTGEVYLNGNALFEEVSLESMNKRTLSWYCEVDDKETRIWANFDTSNPNDSLTEINVRPTCFYPNEPGRNYITVKGFTMRHAASQWAAPTSEQIALIGTHWSKGWIIEDNVISDSKCVGVTLGKYGDEFDNTSANSAEGYVGTINRAQERGWTKDTIGSHVIKNNTIYNCGAAGICGSLGGIFSQIIGNHIYNIHIGKPFTGHEMAAIKFHAPIDSLIKNNRVHHTSRGIWLDWMTQGTRVTGNLLYDNGVDDLYVEVNHGPYMVDNNIFLTKKALKDHSQGGSYSHNLFSGSFDVRGNKRKTPYHKAHSTEVVGLSNIRGGDNRFHNNVLVGRARLSAYNKAVASMHAHGNVYLKGAIPLQGEEGLVNETEFNPEIKLEEENDAVYLSFSLPTSVKNQQNQIVTTELLGKTLVSALGYEQPDGSPYIVDSDYFGKKRNKENPTAGPFENPGEGNLRLKVWPKLP